MSVYVCVCVRACVREFMLAYMWLCVRASVCVCCWCYSGCVCVRACVRECVRAWVVCEPSETPFCKLVTGDDFLILNNFLQREQL